MIPRRKFALIPMRHHCLFFSRNGKQDTADYLQWAFVKLVSRSDLPVLCFGRNIIDGKVHPLRQAKIWGHSMAPSEAHDCYGHRITENAAEHEVFV